MSEPLENKQTAIRYLMGELTKSELDALEERLFSDEEFSVFLDDVETDLVDSYVRGELEFEEKRKFESRYLVSESRHRRVEIARTLQDEVFAKEATIGTTEAGQSFRDRLADLFSVRNLVLGSASAAVLLVLFLGAVWVLTRQDSGELRAGGNSNQETNITPEESPPGNQDQSQDPTTDEIPDGKQDEDKSAAEPNKPDSSNSNKTVPPVKKSPSPKESPAPKPPVQRRTVFATTLLPPLRSSKRPVLEIPAETRTVRLSLGGDYGNQFEKYRVKIDDSLANTVWSGEIPGSGRRKQQAITVSVSADRLKSGAYEVAVRGVGKGGAEEDLTFYNFVVRRP